MKVNSQSDYEKFILADDDTVAGRATLLANGRWAAYDLMGIRRLHDTSITFETAEDVAAFFDLVAKGLGR